MASPFGVIVIWKPASFHNASAEHGSCLTAPNTYLAN